MVHLCTIDSIARRDLHSFSHWHPTYAAPIYICPTIVVFDIRGTS